ncbi:uncharacterized protein LOC113914391 [Zalophus californianus]|uniref:Uncharacterized protein LOC113914391 n=1 Tax=Zalophus californianus TaxID=9704 RepID=A0A6J2C026_ZALCA|nr:uncharacterized protein LOC113914391 [Zalophus californianus]
MQRQEALAPTVPATPTLPPLVLATFSFRMLHPCIFCSARPFRALVSTSSHSSNGGLHSHRSLAGWRARRAPFQPLSREEAPGSPPQLLDMLSGGVFGKLYQTKLSASDTPNIFKERLSCFQSVSTAAIVLVQGLGLDVETLQAHCWRCRSFRIYTENPLVEAMALDEEERRSQGGGGIECPVLLDVTSGVSAGSSRCPAPFRENYYEQFISRCTFPLQKYLKGYSLLIKQALN